LPGAWPPTYVRQVRRERVEAAGFRHPWSAWANCLQGRQGGPKVDRRAGRLPEVPIGRGGGEVRVRWGSGWGLSRPATPYLSGIPPWGWGRWGLSDNRIRWRHRDMLRRCKSRRTRAIELRLVKPHLPHPTLRRARKQAEFVRWGSGLQPTPAPETRAKRR
jgi:hypothetical protein